MTPAIAYRHRRAVELLAITPGDRILEIGCGNGLATGLVCERLTEGRLVAVDRSAKMAAACAKRNAAALAAGRLEVLAGMFEDTGFTDGFDKAFAINVDFPLHPDRGWAERLHAVLRPGGTLVLLMEAPVGASTSRFAIAAKDRLDGAGFSAEILAQAGVVAVRARRNP